MAVVIETTLGDITVDLFFEQRPVTCLNFLKLCKMKYYNFNLFHTIRSGFIAQTGDPTGEGSGGESIFGVIEGPQKRFFSGEKMPKIRHTDTGLLSMVGTDDMMIGSQFFFTLGPDLDSLDGKHCVIGEVTEGQEILRKLNEVICDENHRPYQDVRITHTVILEDPYNDPSGFRAPSRSPSPSAERLKGGRIAPDEELDETQGKTAAEVQEMIEEKEAKARATILEIVGDIPDADIAPPENVLFVCKLNPVTSDEDLEIIFSRFGKIVSCEVIRDKKTGDSLQYAFIEFSDKKSCEDAYFKMDNVLIDDRRIHVDFSQSVSKIKWLGKGRGVKHFSDEEIKKNKHDKKNFREQTDIENVRNKKNREKEHDSYKHSDSRKNKEYNYEREKRRDRKHKNDHISSHKDRSHNRSKRERSRTPLCEDSVKDKSTGKDRSHHQSRRERSRSPLFEESIVDKSTSKDSHHSQSNNTERETMHLRANHRNDSRDSRDHRSKHSKDYLQNVSRDKNEHGFKHLRDNFRNNAQDKRDHGLEQRSKNSVDNLRNISEQDKKEHESEHGSKHLRDDFRNNSRDKRDHGKQHTSKHLMDNFGNIPEQDKREHRSKHLRDDFRNDSQQGKRDHGFEHGSKHSMDNLRNYSHQDKTEHNSFKLSSHSKWRSSPIKNEVRQSRKSPPRSPPGKRKQDFEDVPYGHTSTKQKSKDRNIYEDNEDHHKKQDGSEFNKNLQTKHDHDKDSHLKPTINDVKKLKETRTPTPKPRGKKNDKKTSKASSNIKQKDGKSKTKVLKNKRKPSTSSSDTDSSTSSSDSSSSSESDRKKKRIIKKKKRKHSTSSSSSSTSSSTSSSSSSDSSSNSTTSSSDSDVKRKKKLKPNSKKKVTRKLKKK